MGLQHLSLLILGRLTFMNVVSVRILERRMEVYIFPHYVDSDYCQDNRGATKNLSSDSLVGNTYFKFSFL